MVGLVFLAFKDPGVFTTITAFYGLVLFVPLSADPLRVLPNDRVFSWPLSKSERRTLRIMSPCLSPVTWLVVAVAAWKHVTVGLWAIIIGAFAIGFVLPSLPPARKGAWRRIPKFPGSVQRRVERALVGLSCRGNVAG